MDKLTWKPVYLEDYKDIYVISNTGMVKNIRTNHILSVWIMGGYGAVSMTNSLLRKKRNISVHVLLYRTFNGFSDDGKVINHKDGNKLNYQLDNLELITASENVSHGFKTGLNKGRKSIIFQYDREGNLIKKHSSLSEAAVELGMSRSQIAEVCNGKYKSTRGFVFKYDENNIRKDPLPQLGDNCKIISEFPNYYITKTGRVYSLNRGKYLCPGSMYRGYQNVGLCSGDGKRKAFGIHQLVATYFLPKIEGKTIPNHKDNNPMNNNVENLEWVSPSENNYHATTFHDSTRKKPVSQYTRDGKYIRSFGSATEAGIFIGKKDGKGISQACIGDQPTAYGFKWDYDLVIDITPVV